jgi:hypothetical protein
VSGYAFSMWGLTNPSEHKIGSGIMYQFEVCGVDVDKAVNYGNDGA